MDEALLWKILNASWWQVGLLLVSIGLGIWVIVAVRNYFADTDDLSSDDRKMLDQAQALKQQGTLSEQEYRKIKQQVSTRLKDRTIQHMEGKETL